MDLTEFITGNCISQIEFGQDDLKIRIGNDCGMIFVESDEGTGIRINLNPADAETLCELLPAFIAAANAENEEIELEQNK